MLCPSSHAVSRPLLLWGQPAPVAAARCPRSPSSPPARHQPCCPFPRHMPSNAPTPAASRCPAQPRLCPGSLLDRGYQQPLQGPAPSIAPAEPLRTPEPQDRLLHKQGRSPTGSTPVPQGPHYTAAAWGPPVPVLGASSAPLVGVMEPLEAFPRGWATCVYRGRIRCFSLTPPPLPKWHKLSLAPLERCCPDS